MVKKKTGSRMINQVIKILKSIENKLLENLLTK